MHDTVKQNDPPISRGIKAVGIGKKGSKSLEPELIGQIIEALNNGTVPMIAQGAFFGALMIKGVTEEERRLEEALSPGILTDPKKLVEHLAGDAPKPVQAACSQLLEGETLNVEEAERLGQFLFSNEPGEGARGLVASVLRVRYETPDEYEGLLRSIHATFEEPYKKTPPAGAPIVQMAEPFDGVDHSNMITPLLARSIQQMNYRTVCSVGRNSGPKFGNNLLDIAITLNAQFLQSADEFTDNQPELGWYLNQQQLSKQLDLWVERRHQTIKRPFLSTLERFVNPFKARVMIASAFHPPYGEKMLTVCERAGYPGSIIVRNGLEGTLAFPLLRAAKILCSARQADGTFLREEMVIEPSEHTDHDFKVEERLTDPSLEKNCELITTYQSQGQTGYELFDERIKVTCAGLKKCIQWVEANIHNDQ